MFTIFFVCIVCVIKTYAYFTTNCFAYCLPQDLPCSIPHLLPQYLFDIRSLRSMDRLQVRSQQRSSFFHLLQSQARLPVWSDLTFGWSYLILEPGSVVVGKRRELEKIVKFALSLQPYILCTFKHSMVYRRKNTRRIRKSRAAGE